MIWRVGFGRHHHDKMEEAQLCELGSALEQLRAAVMAKVTSLVVSIKQAFVQLPGDSSSIVSFQVRRLPCTTAGGAA
jgi:hypothetical protein